MTDPDGVITDVNQAETRKPGRSTEEMVGGEGPIFGQDPALAPGFDRRSAEGLGMVVIRTPGEYQLMGQFQVDRRRGTGFPLIFETAMGGCGQ